MLFVLKRAQVYRAELEPENEAILSRCIELCQSGDHEKAATYLLPHLQFNWDWINADEQPSRFVSTIEEISFSCTGQTCDLDVAAVRGSLIITAAVSFTLGCIDGLDLEGFRNWLVENGGWACGHLGLGADWDYACWSERDVRPDTSGEVR